MPDPLLYLAAQAAAATAAAILVLALGWSRKPDNRHRIKLASVVCIAGGLGLGYYVLQLRIAWPPVNGLDRWLTIILPLALGIELVAAFPRVPRWLAWSLRMALVVAAGRILLHGSVYLSGVNAPWTLEQALGVLIVCAAYTAALWGLLAWLAQRSPPGVSIPLALAVTVQSAGAAIMLAGYLTGGAAALPLSAAIVGATLAMRLLTSSPDVHAPLGIGVLGLSSLVFIGRLFGGLSTAAALVLLLTPLLCWVTELPGLRRRKAWIVGCLRLSLVAVPLTVVLVQAKRDFDRDTAPLLTRASAPMRRVVTPLRARRSYSSPFSNRMLID